MASFIVFFWLSKAKIFVARKLQNSNFRKICKANFTRRNFKKSDCAPTHSKQEVMNLFKYVTGYLMGSGESESLVEISGSLYDWYKGGWRCLYVILIHESLSLINSPSGLMTVQQW
jgi:hypothetical protein